MRRGIHRVLLIAALLVALTACEAEPTPLPVSIDPTAGTLAAAPPLQSDSAIRYAIAPNLAPFMPGLAEIDQRANLFYPDTLPTPDQAGAVFDLAVALGALPGWTQTDTPFIVSLMINTGAPPLDDPALRDLVRRAISPQGLVTGLEIPGIRLLTAEPIGDLRAELANAGYPDGFDVRIAAEGAPGIDALTAQLTALGLSVEIVPPDAPDIDLRLVSGGDSPERIDLWSAPISYLAAPGVSVTINTRGVPVPAD